MDIICMRFFLVLQTKLLQFHPYIIFSLQNIVNLITPLQSTGKLIIKKLTQLNDRNTLITDNYSASL